LGGGAADGAAGEAAAAAGDPALCRRLDLDAPPAAPPAASPATPLAAVAVTVGVSPGSAVPPPSGGVHRPAAAAGGKALRHVALSPTDVRGVGDALGGGTDSEEDWAAAAAVERV